MQEGSGIILPGVGVSTPVPDVSKAELTEALVEALKRTDLLAHRIAILVTIIEQLDLAVAARLDKIEALLEAHALGDPEPFQEWLKEVEEARAAAKAELETQLAEASGEEQ